MKFANRADFTGAWRDSNRVGRRMLAIDAVIWYAWRKWRRRP